MNQTQIKRAHRKLWRRVTRYDGYQPWGYDEVTLRITKPGYIQARERLRELFNRAQPS